MQRPPDALSRRAVATRHRADPAHEAVVDAAGLGSAAGEDPEFGALHECAYTLCESCMRDHKCGDMADLEPEAEDDY